LKIGYFTGRFKYSSAGDNFTETTAIRLSGRKKDFPEEQEEVKFYV